MMVIVVFTYICINSKFNMVMNMIPYIKALEYPEKQ